MNFIIHSYKPYKKGNTFITLWFLTLIKYDVLNALENGARRIDYLTYTKPMKDKIALQKDKT